WTKASTWATVLAASVLVAPLLGVRPDTRGPAVSPERAVSIDSVLSLAEVARAAAAVQRDPHMEAISKALEELAASAEAAGATAVEDLNTLEELVAALGRLASPTMTGRERSEGGDGGQNDMVDMESAIAGLEETLGRVAGLTGLNEDLLVFAEDSMSEVSTAGDGATLSGSPDSSSSMP